MGMKVIETNQTINLATYGLKSGDEITVICVGGGAGGAQGNVNGYTLTEGGGNAGNGGVGDSGQYSGGGGGAGAGYGAGGGGAGGFHTNNSSYYRYPGAGGGAGEYKMTSHKLNAATVNSIAVTIGKAGIGGIGKSKNANNGTNGGVTSFGAILSANGGVILQGGAPSGNSGGGGAGGFLLPMRLYGSVGMAGDSSGDVIFGLGGGGGRSKYDNASYKTLQQSQYGGYGGHGTKGGKGVMSKGEGVVVILW